MKKGLSRKGGKCIPIRGSNMYKALEEGENTKSLRTIKRSAWLGEDMEMVVE